MIPNRRRKGRRRSPRGANFFHVAIPGQRFSLTLRVTNRSPVKLERGEAGIAQPKAGKSQRKRPPATCRSTTQRYARSSRRRSRTTPLHAPLLVTCQRMARPHLPDQRPQYLHLPFGALGVFSYEVEGVRFVLSRPAQTVSMDRPWGEQRRLLVVAPAINIAIAPRVGVVPMPLRNLRSTLRSPCRTTSKAMRQAKSNCACQTGGLQRQPSTASHSRTPAKRATSLQCLIAARCNRRGLQDSRRGRIRRTRLYGGVPGHRAP